MTNQTFINSKPTHIFGGAIGTELQARGFKTKLPLWSAPANLEAPELLKQIYIDYINAGSDIAITNTFRTTEWTLKKAGKDVSLAQKMVHASVDIIDEAINETGKDILIGGCVAPLEDCYDTDTLNTAETLENEHEKLVRHLAETGKVDFIIAETQIGIEEAEIIFKLSQKYNLPCWVAFVTDGAKTLNGDDLKEATKHFSKLGAEGILVNCRDPRALTPGVEVLKANATVPYGAYGNGIGEAADELGWDFDKSDGTALELYINEVEKWLDLGAKFVGGCCGTNPDYHQAIKDRFNI